MLNFIYYPVSWIMWVWHWLFDAILPNSPGWSGVAWALSVVFLVFSLRAILYKPFVKQIRTTKQMQEINPQMQAIRKKYANDRVKMTEEMQKLQKEHGFNPLLGCLPMFMQVPVFIGLFHVLRSFNRYIPDGGGFGVPHTGPSLSLEANRTIGNYAFSPEQVQDFLDARLFGVPLSSYVTQPMAQWQAFMHDATSSNLVPVDFTRIDIVIVVVPLMLIASLATHMNSRASVARQTAAAEENPQTRIMNKLALYVFPLGVLVMGVFFPVAILLYWVSNNAWTYGQQHLVFGKIAREEAAAKEAKEERLKAAAPKPGARPDKTKRQSAVAVVDGDVEDSNGSVDLSKDSQKSSTAKGKGQAEVAKRKTGSTAPAAKKAAGATGNKPSPGQRPGGARQAGSKRNKKKRGGR
ncbi:membrane protein insertase YidC [Gordonia hydrophobica]|uniref:Membrane protein insertase YidC n=1 Tax=Gordonia hydrophobica TaxID=40516 RepID=A0ABZ2U5D0_9ACTN|nr:membrane protein insertase YidC [Gordonia hydrophobica]MBM7368724.1 YidC/Oxa1 family membrane protein insertase [Gordonia hydrophobica]